MSTLSLLARFPLGVYYGHRPDRSIDRIPSPARLHAALLNAAAQGSAAQVVDGRLAPTEESLAALRWLEQNPPTGLLQPDTRVTGNSDSRFIYREVSSVNDKRRTEQRRVSDGMALDSAVGYQWENAPDDVATVIHRLAEDVSCLGESTSIVVLEPGDFTPNLLVDKEGSPFELGANFREIALPGRTDELLAAHAAAHPRKVPTVAADKVARTEEPRPSQVTRRNLTEVCYRRPAVESVSDALWQEVHLLGLEREIPARLSVELCASMHKAMIAVIPGSVSPLITGKYLESTGERPANRLAIQYLPPEISAQVGFDGPALALFIPREALAEDIRQIAQGLSVKRLWSRRIRSINLTGVRESLPGDAFWPAVGPGLRRLWKPLTPVIPETRRMRLPAGSGEWTLADSGLLSLGFVWRDEAGVTTRGRERYLDLRNFAESRGAFVVGAHSIGGCTSDYVHRINDSLTAQAWTGVFHLGTLAGERAATMVGQSRHLGGGLLVPFDVREEVMDGIDEEREDA